MGRSQPGRLYSRPMRFGVLTGGGDCPGLNAVIRAIVRKGIDAHGDAIVGFRDGWRGVLENEYQELTIESTRGILHRGGTILGTSSTNPYGRDDGADRVRETLAGLNLEGLIAIGGEDTLGAANRLHEDGHPVVGVPKTIDNDLDGTDVTFGFDTALHVASEAIDRLHTTAESHHRILVVEVMGRHAGWIALHSGVSGGADVILIPEQPFDIDAVCGLLRRRKSRGSQLLDRRRRRGRDRRRTARRRRRRTSWTSSGTAAWAGSGTGSSARSRSGPASRPGRRCSATSSAAAPRPRTTGCWRRASGSRRSTLRTTAQLGRDGRAARERGSSCTARRGGRGAAHRAAGGLRGVQRPVR